MNHISGFYISLLVQESAIQPYGFSFIGEDIIKEETLKNLAQLSSSKIMFLTNAQLNKVSLYRY